MKQVLEKEINSGEKTDQVAQNRIGESSEENIEQNTDQNTDQNIKQNMEQILIQIKEQENKQENKTVTPQAYKSWKEQTYDQIPISVKTLDIIIVILIAVLFLMYTYFIFGK